MKTSIFFITSETEPNFPWDAVIGGSCGVLFVLGLAIFLVPRYQRRKKAKQRSFWEEMPRDELYPGDEKYEMEDKNEGICYYGEITPLPTEARSEGLGFANDAARLEDL